MITIEICCSSQTFGSLHQEFRHLHRIYWQAGMTPFHEKNGHPTSTKRNERTSNGVRIVSKICLYENLPSVGAPEKGWILS